MSPVGKALWYIESHFADEITLDGVAAIGGVSRYHMTRTFAVATGRSVMHYVRGRRLSEAARSLCDGAPDILAVALDAGYGSHEAFTRAFRDQFGLTPEAVRAQRHLDNIQLVEPIRMEDTLTKLAPPRFVDGKPLLIAGLGQRYDCNDIAGLPGQWQRFGSHIGNMPGEVGGAAYGVRHNWDDSGNLDYVCGVEVSDFSGVPDGMIRVRIAPQRYAVFLHREHVSTIRDGWNAALNKWLPEAGYEVADAPDFERYGESFDPHTGTGGVEFWVPLKR